MSLRAVVFDYGMVLSGPPLSEAWEAMLDITALSPERLDRLYWGLRPEYDKGKLNGFGFWQKLAQEASRDLAPAALGELNEWDVRMWTTENPPMLAWQQLLKQSGLKTAILSNMGEDVHARMTIVFSWLSRFDTLTWSYQLGMVKPDEAIYRSVLNDLDLAPEETLFLDDRAPNIETARRIGMRVHQFTTVERLREDLEAQRLNHELPLPE